MLCGVKFCGGCNPRYDRGAAFEQIRQHFAEIEKRTDGTGAEILQFHLAKEEVPYDALLVFGGCSACCASYEQYTVRGDIIKMWEFDQMEETVEKCENWLRHIHKQ